MSSTRSCVRSLVHFTAFGFGAGKVPVAPGTFGTLVAIPMYLLLREAGAGVYAIVVVAMFAYGVWCCGVTERDLGGKDLPGIVWDEIVGFLVAMFAAPAGWGWILAGFVLFRVFDIWKPFPIRVLERRVPGGWGIMTDDVVAGAYAGISLQTVARLFT